MHAWLLLLSAYFSSEAFLFALCICMAGRHLHLCDYTDACSERERETGAKKRERGGGWYL
jgi:hypothetical protein